MSELSGPNVASDLLRIHSVITRGLQVSIDRGQDFARQGFADAGIQEGYLNYVRSLVSTLRVHHLGEDDLAFPYFRDKLPGAPFDTLTQQHHQMEGLLAQADAALVALEAAPAPEKALPELTGILQQVQALWQPHIHVEESFFVPSKIGPMLPIEEHVRLAQQFAQHSQQHGKPDYLLVPFLLYNLSPADRAVMSQAMPPTVTQQLVPIVWKEKWRSMKPFLLD